MLSTEKKKKLTNIFIYVLLLLLLVAIIYIVILIMIPGFLCDYIEYNGVKYYACKDPSLHMTIDANGQVYSSIKDGNDEYNVEVKLYRKNGTRVGIFMRFYAEKLYGDDECEFLMFDSILYTNSYELSQREAVETIDRFITT